MDASELIFSAENFRREMDIPNDKINEDEISDNNIENN